MLPWSKVPSFLKWLLLVILLVTAAFFGGRYSKPAEVKVDRVEVKVHDEEYVQSRIAQYKETHKDEFTVQTHSVTTIVKPCPTAPVPDGGCKAPCATDCSKCPSQTINTTTDTTEHHNSSSTTTGGTTTNTNIATHDTDTTHVVTTTKNNVKPDWHLGVAALVEPKLTLSLNQVKVEVTIERRIIWDIYAGITVVPQANLYGLSLSWNF